MKTPKTDKPKKPKGRDVLLGAIVVTNYGTGPYLIERILGPSTEPLFSDTLAGIKRHREPYYYFECRDLDADGQIRKRDHAYLNGYRLDGTHVSSGDVITFFRPDELEMSLADIAAWAIAVRDAPWYRRAPLESPRIIDADYPVPPFAGAEPAADPNKQECVVCGGTGKLRKSATRSHTATCHWCAGEKVVDKLKR
jgi:hypothetical protein